MAGCAVNDDHYVEMMEIGPGSQPANCTHYQPEIGSGNYSKIKRNDDWRKIHHKYNYLFFLSQNYKYYWLNASILIIVNCGGCYQRRSWWCPPRQCPHQRCCCCHVSPPGRARGPPAACREGWRGPAAGSAPRSPPPARHTAATRGHISCSLYQIVTAPPCWPQSPWRRTSDRWTTASRAAAARRSGWSRDQPAGSSSCKEFHGFHNSKSNIFFIDKLNKPTWRCRGPGTDVRRAGRSRRKCQHIWIFSRLKEIYYFFYYQFNSLTEWGMRSAWWREWI